MYKANKGTRLFIRFLREDHISYAFINDNIKTLDDCGLLERNMFYSHSGNDLLIFSEMFDEGLVSPMKKSILWSNTTRGFFFWNKMQQIWIAYYFINV